MAIWFAVSSLFVAIGVAMLGYVGWSYYQAQQS